MLAKLFLVVFGVFTSISVVYSQDLGQADSLFEGRKFTEANRIYLEIYNEGKASPSMLLKMAFIQEGLESYADALFYLNQYYRLTTNKRVLEKMREIADAQQLQGYDYSDIEFFLHLLSKYRIWIIGVLYAVSAMLVGVILVYQRKRKPIFAPLTVQILVAIILFGITNEFFMKPQGIIDQNQTLLMSGPSAGAEPIDVINRGHKVSIIGETEAWIKIDWGQQSGYIRNNRIRPI